MNSSKRRTVREANGGKPEEGSTGTDLLHSEQLDEQLQPKAQLRATGKADGFPAWFPPGMRKGSRGQGLLLSRLVAGAEQLRELEAAAAADVADARALGASWQLVGLALGISAEGARSRYGRPARLRRGGQDELPDTS